MNRRSFLRVLGLGAAVALVDPRELLPPPRTYFLPPPSGWTPKGLGLSMRIVRQYDLDASGIWVSRLDVLYGVAALRPDFTCRVPA